jgi:hypothetical protein
VSHHAEATVWWHTDVDGVDGFLLRTPEICAFLYTHGEGGLRFIDDPGELARSTPVDVDLLPEPIRHAVQSTIRALSVRPFD